MKHLKSVTAVPAAASIMLTSSALGAPLEPTSKWLLDYDEAQCVASRDYGTKADPISIGFKPSPMGGIMRILVVQNGPYLLADQYTAWVKFGDQPAMKMSALQYAESKKKLRVVSINVPRSVIEANKDAKSITIDTAGLSRTFVLSDVPALLDELDKCLVDLREIWHLGKYDEVAKGPVPNKPLGEVFRSEDYPASALSGHDEGSVQVVLLVDEAGNIGDCSVETSSDIPTLDTMSCYVFQERVHFTPAVDKSGQPVKSGYAPRIKWQVAR